MKNHKAFSVVELLITLVIATVFITAAYQLYSTILTDSGDARKESAASNTAYDYLRRYSAGLSAPCVVYNETISNVSITDVGNSTITISRSCPYATSTDIVKITVSVSYNNPSNTVTYSTYDQI